LVYKLTKNGKRLAVSEDFIAISKKRIEDYDELLKKAQMIAYKDEFLLIKKRHIYNVKYNERGNRIKVYFASETDMNASFEIIPRYEDKVSSIGDDIVLKMGFIKKWEKEGRVKYLLINIFKCINVVFFSFIFVFASISLESVDSIELSGNRKGLIYLLLSFVEFIGPIGTAIIGITITALFVRKTIKRYRNPALVIELTKS